ncbi:MAG: hypothetical protein AAF790_05045 [Planctomycetota bacterium]
MKFGLYLLRRNIITAEQLVAALEKQQEDLPPLGQLAIETGRMSVRDVFRTLRVQAETAKEPFGKLAIGMGLLSRADVAELLLLQSDRRATLDKALAAIGAFTPREGAEHLDAFRRECERCGALPAVAISRSVAATAVLPRPVMPPPEPAGVVPAAAPAAEPELAAAGV